MFCNQCAKKNPDDAKFCQYCGADLSDQPEEKKIKQDIDKNKKTKKLKKKKKIIIISIIAGIILIGGIIGGYFWQKSNGAKDFDTQVKDSVKESLDEGKTLAEKFEDLTELKDVSDLTDETEDFENKLTDSKDKIDKLKTKGGKNEVIKTKAKDYFAKYLAYIEGIKTITEKNLGEGTSDSSTQSESSSSDEITETDIGKLNEKADDLETAYNDLKKEAEAIVIEDFENKIKSIPDSIEGLTDKQKLTTETSTQDETAKKAAEEAAKEKAAEEAEAKDLANAKTTMTNYEKALDQNDLSGFYDSTTSQYQSSADGQALIQAIQNGMVALQSYTIKNSSRVSSTEYKFTVKEGYQSGGPINYSNETYSVVKSGTRWLVDDKL